MSKNQNAIFLSFDEGYLGYAKPCLNSLICNYPNHPTLLINYTGADTALLKKYISNERIRFVSFTHTHNLTPGPIANPSVFNRFHLWGECFSEFEKILHLDADAVVLKPLDELFDEDNFFISRDDQDLARVFKLHDHLLPKGKMGFEKNILEDQIKQDKLEHLVLPGTMANAGVFMVPQIWRSESQYQKLLGLAERYDSFVAYADQSIISIWCHINGIAIQDKPEFNCQIRYLYKRHLNIEDIYLLHYSGEAKFYESLRIHNQYKAIYRECDALRLFYRKTRAPGEDAAIRQRIKDCVQNLVELR